MPTNQNEIRAGFFVRLAAYCIDILIVTFVLSAIKTPFWIMSIFDPKNIFVRDFVFDYSILDIILYCLQVSYFIIMTYKTGSTVGKKLFRLTVVSYEDDELNLMDVIYRETIGRFLSSVVCFIGYFMILVREDKKGLHDLLSNTKVVYVMEQQSIAKVKGIGAIEVLEDEKDMQYETENAHPNTDNY